MRFFPLHTLVTLLVFAFTSTAAPHSGSGSLLRLPPNGDGQQESCPLRHTDVKVDVSGFLAHVTVTQEFVNTAKDTIEAVYTFPLPQNAAVDEMTIHIGSRTIQGKIKRKEEARAVYEAARDHGFHAALLDQERANIFTQSLANIRPGENIKVELRYVETLPYTDGSFEFVFPMVVGPRYIPQGTNGSRITPPIAAKGTRAGHDISLSVELDTGLPIHQIRSNTHEIDQQKRGESQASIRLKDQNEIPNRDFVLRYDVSGKGIEDTVLTHHDARGGFFSMILQPPSQVRAEEIVPRELVFVLDTSGSMSGFPLEKAKETMRLALHDLNPHDTFNLITFSGDTRILFPQPVPANPENLRMAESVLQSSKGHGGTEMMKAIRAALDSSDSRDHLRVVCFMTDGYVGNDLEIISEIQKHAGARVFAFGIGSSVNRFLLDKMAEQGRGEVEYVNLQDDGSAAAKRFYQRVRNPLLTNVSVDWGGLPVTDVYPQRIPDLFSAKPVMISGRYAKGTHGTIRLRGTLGGKPFSREIPVSLPDDQPKHEVIASLWARRKVDALLSQDWTGMESGRMEGKVEKEVTQLGLDFHLLTPYTSFLAVEESVVNEGGRSRRVEVPVELPQGVSYEGLNGFNERAIKIAPASAALARGGTPPFIGQYLTVAPIARPAPAVFRNGETRAKLDSVLIQKLQSADPGEQINVLILLSNASAETLRQLKATGFVLAAGPNTANIVSGHIAVAQLEKLAQLSAVRNVAAK